MILFIEDRTPPRCLQEFLMGEDYEFSRGGRCKTLLYLLTRANASMIPNGRKNFLVMNLGFDRGDELHIMAAMGFSPLLAAFEKSNPVIQLRFS